MQTVARFATRHIDGTPGQTDLFLGIMFKGQGSALKPDHVYEIRMVLDELMIVPVGPSSDPTVWNHDVGEIVAFHKERAFCTEAEVARTQAAQATSQPDPTPSKRTRQ